LFCCFFFLAGVFKYFFQEFLLCCRVTPKYFVLVYAISFQRLNTWWMFWTWRRSCKTLFVWAHKYLITLFPSFFLLFSPFFFFFSSFFFYFVSLDFFGYFFFDFCLLKNALTKTTLKKHVFVIQQQEKKKEKDDATDDITPKKQKSNKEQE